jgi:hypothetical protein
MAAAAEGVSTETVRRWRQRYPAFAAQVEQARASCVVRLLGCLNKAALGGNWKAAAWLLERTRPASYGPPPRRVGLDVGMSVPDFSQMSDADLEAYVVKLGGPAALGLSASAVTPLTSLPTPQHPTTPGGSNGRHSTED